MRKNYFLASACLFAIGAVLNSHVTLASPPDHTGGALKELFDDFLKEDLKPWLEDEGTSEIAIGSIAPPPSSTAGAMVADLLLNSAKDNGLEVKKLNARFALGGRFVGAREGDVDTVRFDFWINDADQNNDQVMEFSTLITDMSDVVKLLGLTSGEENSNESYESEHGSTNSAANEIHANAQGYTIYPNNTKSYGIQILVKRDGRYEPKKPYYEEGYPFVSLAPDDVYAVRVINNGDSRMAVDLSIDGFSYFRWQEGTSFSHFILGNGKTSDIKGWFITLQKAREFLVQTLSNVNVDETVQARSERNRMGTITVQFHKAYHGARSRSLFTDQGQEISANYSTVRATWDPEPEFFVSIRYDKR